MSLVVTSIDDPCLDGIIKENSNERDRETERPSSPIGDYLDEVETVDVK